MDSGANESGAMTIESGDKEATATGESETTMWDKEATASGDSELMATGDLESMARTKRGAASGRARETSGDGEQRWRGAASGDGEQGEQCGRSSP
jgi:hypothetical protein